MTRFEPPDQTRQAVSIAGQLAVLFPGMPYKRYVRSVIVKCSVNSSVSVYAGLVVDNCRIGSNSAGSSNTFSPTNPKPVPAGVPVYVVWPDAAVTDTASATLSCEGEW